MVTEGEQGTEVSWVDVVVICALEVEFRAISKNLVHHSELSADVGLGLQHFVALEGSGLTVLVVRLPDPGAGNVTSGIVASLLIARYDPWLLISFGIAGTLDSKEVKTLDVLYSKSVFYIDLRKETSSGSVMKRPVQRDTPMPLLILLRNLPPAEGYTLHEADIVASEAVVKSEEAERRKAAQQAVADAKSVEMESFGVFQACFVDEGFFTKTSRLCLAIKGISDAADPDKSSEFQEIAASNAAKFLSVVLRAPGLGMLRRESGVNRRPRPLQPFVRRPPSEVFSRVEKFRKITESIALQDWDESTLHAVLLRCKYPRVFYHWRLTGNGLHWVEFKFVCILQRLAKVGFPVECLIGDRILSMPHLRLTEQEIPGAREANRRILNALLPERDGSSLSFYSEISDNEEFLTYAQAAGYWREIRNSLTLSNRGGIPSIPSGTQVKLEFNEWLQYVAWQVRHEGVCVCFFFQNYNVYSLLLRFSGLIPALIPTGDIKLGGKWGKFELPGSDLFILPPDHPTIVRWLTATSEAVVLGEFWGHLTAQDGLAEDALVRKRRAWAGHGLAGNVPRGGDLAWIEQFRTQEERTSEYYKGAILLELAWLNATFFADFREKSSDEL
jgi:nucleoside phosphorylase